MPRLVSSDPSSRSSDAPPLSLALRREKSPRQRAEPERSGTPHDNDDRRTQSAPWPLRREDSARVVPVPGEDLGRDETDRESDAQGH